MALATNGTPRKLESTRAWPSESMNVPGIEVSGASAGSSPTRAALSSLPPLDEESPALPRSTPCGPFKSTYHTRKATAASISTTRIA